MDYPSRKNPAYRASQSAIQKVQWSNPPADSRDCTVGLAYRLKSAVDREDNWALRKQGLSWRQVAGRLTHGHAAVRRAFQGLVDGRNER